MRPSLNFYAALGSVLIVAWAFSLTMAGPTVHEARGQLVPSPMKPGIPIEERASESAKRTGLTEYLKLNAPHLIPCVGEIIRHRRFVEAVAITRIETGFCTKGHGPTKNNCGNVSSSLPGLPNGRFKTYRNKCDSIEDIAILLERNRYRGKTVDEINGIYCIDETTEGYGGPCPNWTETTMEEVNSLRRLIHEAQVL